MSKSTTALPTGQSADFASGALRSEGGGTRIARILTRIAALTGWRTRTMPVARGRCHFLLLDVRNIPRRHVAASLRLQLAQLTGQLKTGFAWRVVDGWAHIWHWDESAVEALAPSGGRAPWPEPLLRETPGDGLHLLACAEGYEAVAIEGGLLRRTRWQREMPTDAAWAAFVRDAGRDPADQPLAPAKRMAATASPVAGWKLFSHQLKPVPLAAWLGAGAAALLGMVLIGGAIYGARLDEAQREKQDEIRKLKQDNATTLALQKQIAEQGAYLETMAKARPGVLQLLLMKDIAESGLVGGETGISIAEWEYRSGRLRLLFVVPEDTFNLSEFLARLEGRPIFREIRLMPDTPPRTVGIQALLAGSTEAAARNGGDKRAGE